MSSQQPSLTINFNAPQDKISDGPLLQLEQESWSEYAGKMTKMQLVRTLYIHLFGTIGVDNSSDMMNCPIDASGYATTRVFAYPSRRELDYKLITSYGNLAGAAPGSVVIDDTLQFKISRRQDVQYPVQRIVSSQWLTCYCWASSPGFWHANDQNPDGCLRVTPCQV